MNRWYFWVLAPILLATAVAMPLITPPLNPIGTLVAYAFTGRR